MADWIDEVVSVFLDSLDKHTKSNRGIQKGDILGVDRGLYEHYAVYVGDDRVIHYTGGGDDFGGDVAIRESPFRDFLGEETTYFVCEFPENHKPPHKRQQFASSVMQDMRWLMDVFQESQYHLFSPEETVERAYSRLGERDYNLLTNNCEHFAIWCKTNISESWQVEELLGGDDILRLHMS